MTTPHSAGAARARTALLRSTRTMAVGTVASRGSGFLRTAVLAAALGVKGVALAFQVANTAPNIVYELLLGGILTSVVVPLLVRADADGQGEAYLQRLLTLVVLVLGAAAVVLVVFAPAIFDIYATSSVTPADRALGIDFERFFLPQLLFYGIGAVLGAHLNVRGRFGPPVWAPVLNNVVVIVTGVLFVLLPGPSQLTSGTITHTQIGVLGIGVTLGVVVQTVALVPALRASGFRFRLRADLRGTGLGPAAQLARWTLFYVVCNQVVLVVVVRLASTATPGRGYPSYVNAFLLWQLPHAVVAVSVITALLPSMSRAAQEGRLIKLRLELDRGLRLMIAALVPSSIAYVVLGRAIAAVVFGHGRVSGDEATFIGQLLAVFALGLVAFSTYQVQLRAFYALSDTRTPALVNLAVNVTTIVVDVLLWAVLPSRWIVLGLAAGQAASYLVGVVVCTLVLLDRVPRDPSSGVLRSFARCLAAAAVPGVVVDVLLRVAGPDGFLGALLQVVVGGALLAGGYVLLARRLHIDEVDAVAEPLLARFSHR